MLFAHASRLYPISRRLNQPLFRHGSAKILAFPSSPPQCLANPVNCGYHLPTAGFIRLAATKPVPKFGFLMIVMSDTPVLHRPASPVYWQHFDGIQPYLPTIDAMQAHAAAIRAAGAPESVWLLQHDAIYTGGTSARDDDLLAPGDIPAVRIGRGGQWTYHGPGQRVAYVMLDLGVRGHDVRALVHGLESWVIACLADCGVIGQRRDGLPGIWVDTGNSISGLDKIAAIGIRISRWVSWHGLAINLNPDLAAFDAIVPCGQRDSGVTSLAAIGVDLSMTNLDDLLKARFSDYF